MKVTKRGNNNIFYDLDQTYVVNLVKITKNIQDQSPFQRTFSSGISHWHFTSIYIRYIKHCRACLLTLKNYFLLYFGTVPPIVVFTSPILLYWTRSSYDLPLYYNYSCNKNCLTKIRGHFYNSSVVGGGGGIFVQLDFTPLYSRL